MCIEYGSRSWWLLIFFFFENYVIGERCLRLHFQPKIIIIMEFVLLHGIRSNFVQEKWYFFVVFRNKQKKMRIVSWNVIENRRTNRSKTEMLFFIIETHEINCLIEINSILLAFFNLYTAFFILSSNSFCFDRTCKRSSWSKTSE